MDIVVERVVKKEVTPNQNKITRFINRHTSFVDLNQKRF